MAQLCLGTVQFGMYYGINNQIGRQPTWEDSFEMIDYALSHGINTIDTARAYGEAELLLGEYFKSRSDKCNVKLISKLRPNCMETKDIRGTIESELTDSLQRLRIDVLDGYLLHTPEYILEHEIVDGLVNMKEQGLVKNIGVSIYDIKHGYAAIDTGIVDYIQLPYSVFDQRGSREGFISAARKAGITIFTRSAFLQGLFMMDAEAVPERVKKSVPYLLKFNELLEKYNVDRVSALLGFVKRRDDIDYLVFGVEKIEQLIEDLQKYKNIIVPDGFYQEVEEQFGQMETSIIIPSLWSNGRRAE